MDKNTDNLTDIIIENIPANNTDLPTDKQFLTAREVSENFFHRSVSYDKVLRMSRSGDLPRLPIPNRYLYRLDILEEWARKNLKTTTDSNPANLQ